MKLQSFPSFSKESSLLEDLRRVSQIRDDDISAIQTMGERQTHYGPFFPATREVSASKAVGLRDYHLDVDATGGAITITLPAPSQALKNRQLVITKADSSGNAVTISGNGANINGSSTASISSQYGVKRIHFLPTAGEWREV